PPAAFFLREVLPGAAGRGNLIPLILRFDVIEGECIDVIGLQPVQYRVELALGLTGGTCLKLRCDHYLAPRLAHAGDRAAHSIGMPAPVQVVDTAANSPLDVFSLKMRITARGKPEAAYRGKPWAESSRPLHQFEATIS